MTTRPSEGSTSARYFTEDNSVEAVNGRMGAETDARFAVVMSSLVKHLHAFAREIELTQDEWEIGIEFLTRTGQICSQERQEFILLSDTLGFSMLVDAINNRRPEGATENTVFGPFHVEGAPVRSMGDSICLDGKGETCLFIGRVIDLGGNPIEGARIDVWSDNAEGYYDVQQPDVQPKWNNRGVFVTGADGHYSFVGIKPVSYPIPDDGPVGTMLGNLGRHPFRPAHMHYMVRADGFQKLVTHTFVGGDPYLESDTVFGVKKTLVAPFEKVTDGSTQWRSDYDFVLVRPDQTR
ncbi:intradiol ring-cleavage dioxygenase [Shinella yambaruensis]|uniref:6-chlorohydroxyquinol-1,2-dioxygenase n=1 Tax=Shinella yambaruensis TaxID=415996 RepID=A0ABQ5ZP62_9HYPH|nr:intradiol ring-cleavage dioxygenase [Shinella yambaruensis]MCJ8026255.1 intradiol ring-cleavage dioxygenase [Shinella yambaruensis]MCU7981662.1 intradiol ring-cleavage dioxygenase [Shinella yambaruensis]GLR53607.1 6-chlorohydroxyquinol-1,2-dioxygenase [Shinella yambaruensis]